LGNLGEQGRRDRVLGTDPRRVLKLVDDVLVGVGADGDGVPELAGDLDERAAPAREQRGERVAQHVGHGGREGVIGWPSRPGNTGVSSPGRPDAIRHSRRSAASGSSSRTVRRRRVLRADAIRVRSLTSRQSIDRASWGRIPA
jgi:hypothetical protein